MLLLLTALHSGSTHNNIASRKPRPGAARGVGKDITFRVELHLQGALQYKLARGFAKLRHSGELRLGSEDFLYPSE